MEEWTSSEEEEEEGESDRKQTEAKVERKEEERKEKKERRKRRKMKKYNEEEEWEEDIQRLMASGIRNRLHTVELSRSENMDPGWPQLFMFLFDGTVCTRFRAVLLFD
jgi:hypothetical protein